MIFPKMVTERIARWWSDNFWCWNAKQVAERRSG